MSEKKLTPATKEWAETAPIESLKAFLAKAPAIPALTSTGTSEPSNTTPRELAPDIAGKSWEQLSPAQKHDLFVEDRPAYDALKADYVRRGSPKLKAAA